MKTSFTSKNQLLAVCLITLIMATVCSSAYAGIFQKNGFNNQKWWLETTVDNKPRNGIVCIHTKLDNCKKNTTFFGAAFVTFTDNQNRCLYTSHLIKLDKRRKLYHSGCKSTDKGWTIRPSSAVLSQATGLYIYHGLQEGIEGIHGYVRHCVSQKLAFPTGLPFPRHKWVPNGPHIPPVTNKTVSQAFCRVLERSASNNDINHFKQYSARQLVSILAKSGEHVNRFYRNNAYNYVRKLYDHLLARGAGSSEINFWVNVYNQNRNWNSVVDGFVNSAEYSQKFGNNKVPGNGRGGCR